MATHGKSARLAVDIGGTFTDVVVENGGKRTTAKVLTTSQAPEEGVLEGIASALDGAGLTVGDVGILIHGTTLATNAIIERKGATTALITTEGFRDVLDIAYETRYDQYDVFLDKTSPLVPRYLRLTVPERLAVNGQILKPLDEDAVRALLPILDREKVESVAIGFLHAYADGAHEQRAREILAEARPDLTITLSSEVCPEVREYERFTTATANAYVQPLMARYLTRLQTALDEGGFDGALFLMTSGGGLTTLETAVRFPIRLVESGPAGGAILATGIARECGTNQALSFDMGGTTAKICLIEDFTPETGRSFEVAREARFQKGSGLPLRIPVIEMVEIGAGGGSIAAVDSMQQITVGPHSAGSEPGPACYDRGGNAPTVTDGDVALGRIDPESFAGGKVRLVPEASAAALDKDIGTPLGLSSELAAYGVIEMVDENMANAARVHSIERGKVIGEHTIIAFGGAAPLHASRLAEKLGIDRIIVPTNAGVGSAVGFLRAPIAYEVVRSRYMTLRDFDPALANDMLQAMRNEAMGVVQAGAGDAPLTEKRIAFMRYMGQGHEIVVPLPNRDLTREDTAMLKGTYDREYEALYGRTIPDADIEVLTWAMTVGTEAASDSELENVGNVDGAQPVGSRQVYDAAAEAMTDVPLYRRDELKQGMHVSGPAILAEDETSTFVSGSFDVSVNRAGYLVLERKA
ncbi:MAG: hydantoinase/oxoprolinase family protein [Alphaproteobacteria bacterium]|nr:hydantoinase/oxoprolinase family protein [Alphaproteobacteria bacterium]